MTEKTTTLIERHYEYPNRSWGLSEKLTRKLTNSWRVLALPLLSFIAIPLIALFLRAPISELFVELDQKQMVQAIQLSIFTSLSTTLIALLFGTPVAVMLAQRKFRLYRIVDTLIDLPTVLPPSVAGIALLLAFGRKGLFGAALTAMNINIPFTFIAVIMAQTFIAAPLYIKAATIGFSAVNLELRQAAALDGANRWQIFRFVTVPMSWTSILSGSVMTWARALGEFGATIIFAGNFPGRTQTMPLAIYMGFEINLNVAITLALIMICFSFLTLIIVKRILHNQLNNTFQDSAEDSCD